MQTIKPLKPDPKYRDTVLSTLERMAKEDAMPIVLDETGCVPFDLSDDSGANGRHIYSKCRYVLAKCESPIERRLIFALSFELFYALDVQIRLANFRADFGFPELKLAVECDGHDFHKSKEQRTHDAQRDRLFTREGWNVIRFTGSEIVSNPDACAKEVQRIYEAAKTT